MKVEVICIKTINVPPVINTLGLRNVPKIQDGNIYTAIGLENKDGAYYYTLAEYPPEEAANGEEITHLFDATFFAEVQSLQEQINEALKAPVPDKKIYTENHASDAMDYFLHGFLRENDCLKHFSTRHQW